MKKECLLFSSFPDYSGNSKALYEYLKAQKTKMELVWVCYNEKNKEVFEAERVNYVMYRSEEFEQAMEKVTMIFDTHGALLEDKREGQIYINLWHGFGPKSSGWFLDEKTMAPQDLDYLRNMEEQTDYIVVPSRFWQAIFSGLFHVHMHRILPLGLARCDKLFSSKGKENLQKMVPEPLKNYQKIIGYLPTFRKGCNREDGDFTKNIFNFPSYNENDFLSYLEKNQILLVIKLHPSEETAITKVDHPNVCYLNDQTLTHLNLTIYDLLNAFDLVISDYSSIYIEYLNLKRPVMFVHPDMKTYRKKRTLIFENEEFWFPGPQTKNIEEFQTELLKLLEDTTYYQKEREKFTRLMNTEDGKGNCERIYHYLFKDDHRSEKIKPKETKDEERKDFLNERIKLQKQVSNVESEYKKLYDEKVALEAKLDAVYNSRTWKLMQSIKKVRGRRK